VVCEIDGQPIAVRQSGFSKVAPGDDIRLAWTEGDEHRFDQATGARLASVARHMEQTAIG
jgi:sn-glycerol 3-phosphate transport system ATP-binding protein